MSEEQLQAGPQPSQQNQQPPTFPEQPPQQAAQPAPPPQPPPQSPPPPPPANPNQLTILAGLHYFSAMILFVCVPIFIWLGLHVYQIGQQQNPNDSLFADIGYTTDLFYPLIALLCVITAAFAIFHGALYMMGGLWCQRRRRMKGLMAILLANALIFPVGTMISAYGYYVISQPGIKALFED